MSKTYNKPRVIEDLITFLSVEPETLEKYELMYYTDKKLNTDLTEEEQKLIFGLLSLLVRPVNEEIKFKKNLLVGKLQRMFKVKIYTIKQLDYFLDNLKKKQYISSMDDDGDKYYIAYRIIN